MMIQFSIPNFEGNEKKYVNEALDAGLVSTGGAFITKFEENLADYINLQYYMGQNINYNNFN